MANTRALPGMLLLAMAGAYQPQVAMLSRSRVLSHACARAPPRAAVAANMADRFVRLVKANVNKALNNAEDPEVVLDQAVIDMQKDLVKVRQSYAEVTASQRRMKEQMRSAEDEAGKWYKRAQLALEKGEEDMAREALERRRSQDDLAQNLATQLERQDSSLSGLYDAMKELEAKITEAKMKKDQYIARARTAKASSKVNDMLSEVGSSSAVAAFERMKDKVEALEAEAEAVKEMKQMSGGAAPSSVEEKFKRLEGGTKIDDELAKLRASLPSAQKKAELPPGDN
ncbi:phage shock protein A, PspA [Pavlovales sp. CCMP2436]|nr:phage shock protein A, PspA [Pavlovales sp. CCMP2436]